MLASVLKHAGYRVGLYTSPHLLRFAERIQINGEPLNDTEVDQRISDTLTTSRRHNVQLTFFEVCTVVAYEAFRDHACHIAVIEVGLGGRFDATNVITPKVSVITSIDLDHTHVLGHDLAAIAQEKAGIIKRHVPVVVGEQKQPARTVIENTAHEHEAPCYELGRDFHYQSHADELSIVFAQKRFDHLVLGLRGEHQRRNAACAVAALTMLEERGFLIGDDALRRGLENVRWPGRCDLVGENPTWFLDAAHNAAGVSVLAHELKNMPRTGKRVLMFSAMKDKAADTMLALLRPLVDEIIVVQLDNERAIDAKILAKAARATFAASPLHAINMARELATQDAQIIVCGSIFLLSQVYAHALGYDTDPPILL